MERIIERLKQLPEPQETFLEVLKIHEREVPISNLLAYFFDPRSSHGYGDLFIRALLKTMCYELDVDSTCSGELLKYKGLGEVNLEMNQQEEEIDIKKSYSISNVEVHTEYNPYENQQEKKELKGTDESKKRRKRIDIVIETEKFIVVIEFKINHKLNNPLEIYQDYINNHPDPKIRAKFENKKKFFIILTPNKKAVDVKGIEISKEQFLKNNEAFKQMIFSHFIRKVNEEIALSPELVNSTLSKSNSYYFSDFIQTVQNREIKYKRKLLLENLNKNLGAVYHRNGKGGYLKIEKEEFVIKIRIENGCFQVEKWINSEKTIIGHLGLTYSMKGVLELVSNHSNIFA